MRTTLTIADEIDALVRKVAAEQHRSYKEVVNEALKRGLDHIEVHRAKREYHVQVKDFRLRPGVDPAKLNQLYDELEAGE